MDYFLEFSGKDDFLVLHKKACKKFKRDKEAIYIGYFWGEYSAVREAAVKAMREFIVCASCMNQNNKKE
ncbi:hypothetical protein Q4R98_15445 [Morganella morganii]|nr:hypothetical protein [Morganella morganii]